MNHKVWSIRLDRAVPRNARIIVEADANLQRIAVYPHGGYAPAMPSLTPDAARRVADRVARAADWIESAARRGK